MPIRLNSVHRRLLLSTSVLPTISSSAPAFIHAPRPPRLLSTYGNDGRGRKQEGRFVLQARRKVLSRLKPFENGPDLGSLLGAGPRLTVDEREWRNEELRQEWLLRREEDNVQRRAMVLSRRAAKGLPPPPVPEDFSDFIPQRYEQPLPVVAKVLRSTKGTATTRFFTAPAKCKLHRPLSPFSHQRNDPETLVVFTDGAVKHGKHPPPGGGVWFGVGVFFGPDSPYNVSAPLVAEPTVSEDDWKMTLQRAEITAALVALRALRDCRELDRRSVILATDSHFLFHAMTDMVNRWRRNKWMLPGGRELPNRDLLKETDGTISGMERAGWRVRFWAILKTKNHDAEELAFRAIDAQRGTTTRKRRWVREEKQDLLEGGPSGEEVLVASAM